MARTATRERPAQQQPAQPAPTGNLPASAGQQNKPAHPIVAFKQYMDQRMGEVALALPPQISPERFARVVLTALQRKPELLKCTRQSLFNACMLAAQDGLLPDGREGAIAPYGENADGKRVAEIATWMPMVEGLRKKARNSGEISDWTSQIVRARDHFKVILGDNPKIEHEPYFGPDEPGEIIGAYSIAWLKDGTISRDVMTIRDIKKIEAKSKAKNGPWKDATFFPEMCKKTVCRRHYKQLPHSSDLDAMIKRDDEAFGFEDREEAQIEARQNTRIGSMAAAFDAFGSAGGGPVIDADAEPTGTQDDPTPEDDLTGEYDDEASAQASGGEQQQPAQQSKQQPAQDAQQPVQQAGAEISQGDEHHRGEAPSEDDDSMSELADGPPQNTAAAWPADKKPANPDEYQRYADAYLAAETDPSKIAEWFKGPEQRQLRNACNVAKDVFDIVKAAAMDRIAALKKG